MTAHFADEDQHRAEEESKHHELAALRLEEIEKIARVHGVVGGLFVRAADTGGVMRASRTVKSFFNDNSFRPPSGVPVIAK